MTDSVTHFLYASSKRACERVAEALRREGFAVDVHQLDGGVWSIAALHSLMATSHIDDAEALVSGLAERAGVKYDGYERGRTSYAGDRRTRRPD